MLYEGHSVTEECDPAFSYPMGNAQFLLNIVNRSCSYFTLCSVPISGKDWGLMFWLSHGWNCSSRNGTGSHWRSAAMFLASLLRLTPCEPCHTAAPQLCKQNHLLYWPRHLRRRPWRKSTLGRSRTFGYCVLAQPVLHRHLLDKMPHGTKTLPPLKTFVKLQKGIAKKTQIKSKVHHTNICLFQRDFG